MISKMLFSANPAYYEFSEHQLARIDPTHYPGLFDETIYESDEFRMYGFKIKRCPRTRSHDWTQCPFAHRGEKARRRDPRRYNYAAVSCPDYRDGLCLRGDICPYAHGVFEYWLHPSKYRTRACNAGPFCERKVCFFAHAPEELRDEVKAKRNYVYRAKSNGEGANRKAMYNGERGTSPKVMMPTAAVVASGGAGWVGNTDFLASLSGLTIREKDKMGRGILGKYVPRELVPPEIDWIAELME